MKSSLKILRFLFSRETSPAKDSDGNFSYTLASIGMMFVLSLLIFLFSKFESWKMI